MNLLHPRDEIADAIGAIYRYRMTTTSGGNISILTNEGDTWITPAGVDKGRLTREDIVCVHPNGEKSGLHRPSSEFLFHKAIYQSASNVRAIVHAHPTALVAFSIARQVPDTRIFRQSFSVCGEVGYAAYALPGSQLLGDKIGETFAKGYRSVVLENHGVVVGGTTLREAFQRFETLEFTAKTAIMASRLGPMRSLTPEQISLADEAEMLPTDEAQLDATIEEKELRRLLCDFIQRGYRQRLLISTEGTFSARMGEDDFLITSYGVDRSCVAIEDLVRIRSGVVFSHGAPRRASRAAALHRAIYLRNPGVHSIANAYPVHASAFSVTDAELDSRTIPESYIFLRDVLRIPFGRQFTSPGAIAEQISLNSPVSILDNDGVLVVGKSILDAFDRLEVLETTAEAILHAHLVGPIQAMEKETIDELCTAFGLTKSDLPS